MVLLEFAQTTQEKWSRFRRQKNWFLFVMDGESVISGGRKIEKHQALLLSTAGEQMQ
jgi:hypothetical protein